MNCDTTFLSIAGFCWYYGQPVISRDRAFDRVRGLRRLAY
jgi:predicted nucleic acid-binding protein